MTAPSPQLIASIKAGEGLRLKAYQDDCGIWTCGYGHAHVTPGTVFTPADAERILLDDIFVAEHRCDLHIPWWRNLDPVRSDVLWEMMFNMGWDDPRTPKLEGLSSFVNTLEAIRAKDYCRAAVGMMASKWARQTGNRAKRLAEQMRTGERA